VVLLQRIEIKKGELCVSAAVGKKKKRKNMYVKIAVKNQTGRKFAVVKR